MLRSAPRNYSFCFCETQYSIVYNSITQKMQQFSFFVRNIKSRIFRLIINIHFIINKVKVRGFRAAISLNPAFEIIKEDMHNRL